MKKTPLEKLRERRISPPKRFYAVLLRLIIKCMQSGHDVTYKYSFDKREMQGRQVILLADHATAHAFKYVLYGYPFVSPNVVIGYQNIFVKGLFGLLMKGQIIPKQLYQSDIKSVMEMIHVLRVGGSLCLFPEGIQSSSGSTHPIFPGTASLIKKAGVTVVLCKSYGSYFVRPRYQRVDNKGHQEFHYEILFTEDEIARLSEDEIYEKLLNRFKYNDFEWNESLGHEYIGHKGKPLAEGIDSIIYRCPRCKSEFTIKTQGEEIICTNCQNTVVMNKSFGISPKTENDYLPYSSIDKWFKSQRAEVGKEVKSDFLYEYECELYDLHTEKLSTKPFYKCGEGRVSITNAGIRYVGTRHGEKVNLSFDIKMMPSFIYSPNLGNDLYYKGVYYSFRPRGDKRKTVKYTLLVEEAHRLSDEVWDKISSDAFGTFTIK